MAVETGVVMLVYLHEAIAERGEATSEEAEKQDRPRA
jgi:hypothetical protein